MAIEVSQNIIIAGNGSLYRDICGVGTSSQLYGNTVATLVLPEHNEMFRRGILPIMAGKIATSAAMTPLHNGGESYSSVFGILDLNGAKVGDETTTMFVPSIVRDVAVGLDDPQAALAAYHQNLIEQTNDILATVDSEYRLAPVEVA